MGECICKCLASMYGRSVSQDHLQRHAARLAGMQGIYWYLGRHVFRKTWTLSLNCTSSQRSELHRSLKISSVICCSVTGEGNSCKTATLRGQCRAYPACSFFAYKGTLQDYTIQGVEPVNGNDSHCRAPGLKAGTRLFSLIFFSYCT